MATTSEQDPVLVTGGSGYLAGTIIAQLLAAGRQVRTTIRDLARADEVRATLQRHASTQGLSFHAATCWPTRAGTERSRASGK